jgi:hypothetical protein
MDVSVYICRGCKAEMVTQHAAKNHRHLAERYAMKTAHGLCKGCYEKASRAGTLPDPAPATKGPCRDCKREMVGRRQWAAMTTEEREGHARHGAGDRCATCNVKAREAAKPKPVEAPPVQIQREPPAAPVLEGERRRAALAVCHLADNATEAAHVLDMLGLLDTTSARAPAEVGTGRWN